MLYCYCSKFVPTLYVKNPSFPPFLPFPPIPLSLLSPCGVGSLQIGSQVYIFKAVVVNSLVHCKCMGNFCSLTASVVSTWVTVRLAQYIRTYVCMSLDRSHMTLILE